MSSDSLLISFTGKFPLQVDLFAACKRELALAKREKREPRFNTDSVREGGNLKLRSGTLTVNPVELEIVKSVLGESNYKQWVLVHDVTKKEPKNKKAVQKPVAKKPPKGVKEAVKLLKKDKLEEEGD